MGKRGLIMAGGLLALTLAGYGTGFAQVAWHEVLSFIALEGKPVAASPARLSEHEIQELDRMTPQVQAVLLLERAINHYDGAIEFIDKRVDSWRGSLKLDGQLNTLFTSALNSNDLRVRAAAIEVDLAANNVEKSAESVNTRMQALEAGDGDRITHLWILGLLGSRGIEPERVFQVLFQYVHDPDVHVRYWAVEGLSYLGTDATIQPLLEIFRHDSSANIRERAACGLAQSGMLQQSQRMKAVPALLTYLEDPTFDESNHQWVIQALQDISGQAIGDNPGAWRRWYASR
jgi:hypothetical protein